MNGENRYLRYLFFLVLVGAAVAAFSDFTEIDLVKLKAGDILELLLTALFVSLVIERAVEVYANNRFDPKRSRIRLALSAVENKIEFLEKQLTEEAGRTGVSSESAKKIEAAIDTERERMLEIWRGEKLEDGTYAYTIASELAELKREKAAYTATISTILGLAAAIVGVRILGQFIPTDDAGVIVGTLAPTITVAATAGENLVEFGLQLKALRFVDVVLTTALLAGGADGIHQIIKRITDIRSGA